MDVHRTVRYSKCAVYLLNQYSTFSSYSEVQYIDPALIITAKFIQWSKKSIVSVQ
jgi:hypothetical protein